MLKTIGTTVVALFAPRRCPGCDLEEPEGQTGFCQACLPLLEPLGMRASRGLHSVALYRYGGPLRDAVVRMKFSGRFEIAAAFEADMKRGARYFCGLVEAVVPVPLHPRRFRERGFNQSHLLGRFAAKELRIPMRASLLQRVRYEQPKTKLELSERQAAVVDAFIGRQARSVPATVLLIDDVRTTGATLRACSLALRAAGVQKVFSLTLAASG